MPDLPEKRKLFQYIFINEKLCKTYNYTLDKERLEDKIEICVIIKCDSDSDQIF